MGKWFVLAPCFSPKKQLVCTCSAQAHNWCFAWYTMLHAAFVLVSQVIIAGGISPSLEKGVKGYTNFGGYIHFSAGLAAGVALQLVVWVAFWHSFLHSMDPFFFVHSMQICVQVDSVLALYVALTSKQPAFTRHIPSVVEPWRASRLPMRYLYWVNAGQGSSEGQHSLAMASLGHGDFAFCLVLAWYYGSRDHSRYAFFFGTVVCTKNQPSPISLMSPTVC